MLRPLARLLLKRGLSYGVFSEATKLAFVEAALHDLALPGKKPTASRISTLTGLSRKQVSWLLNLETTGVVDAQHKLNRAARVIGGWISDRRFTDKNQQPLSLAFDGVANSFSTLVRDYSGDIPPRTIADELTRLGAIALTTQGELQLLRAAYIPAAGSDEQINFLADDVADLLNTITHNIEHTDPQHKRFQRKVFYNNIPVEVMEELRQYIAAQGQQCLETINRKLAHYDRDNHPAVRGTKRIKVGLAIHAIEEPLP